MRRLLVLAFLSCVCLASSCFANSATEKTVVKVITDSWCPYTCADTSEDKGLFYAVVKGAFDEVDLPTQYQTSSWTRAIQNTKSGTHDVLLGADSEHETALEVAHEFFIFDKTVFAVRKNHSVVLNEGKDLHHYMVGHISDYTYDDTGEWEDFIENHPKGVSITSSQGEVHLLELLIRKRIDVAVVNLDVANLTLKLKPEWDGITFINKNIASKLYVAFHRSPRGAELRQKFKEGFYKLLGSGKLQEIFDRYNIIMPEYTRPTAATNN